MAGSLPTSFDFSLPSDDSLQVIGADYDGMAEVLYLYFDGILEPAVWPAGWFSIKATSPQDADSAEHEQGESDSAAVTMVGQGGLSTGLPRGVYTGPTGGIRTHEGRELPTGFEFPVNVL